MNGVGWRWAALARPSVPARKEIALGLRFIGVGRSLRDEGDLKAGLDDSVLYLVGGVPVHVVRHALNEGLSTAAGLVVADLERRNEVSAGTHDAAEFCKRSGPLIRAEVHQRVPRDDTVEGRGSDRKCSHVRHGK